jgi:hypothetical protein
MPRPCARECPIALKSPVRRENLSGIEPLGVLAGLVPAIPRRMRSIRPHAERMQETFEVGGFRTAWMPGTSPGTTRGDVCDLRFTTGLAEPDSRGLVPGIHAQKPSPTTSKVVCNGAACGRMLRIRLGMAGTSPAKTSKGSAQPNCISDSATFRFPRTALPAAGGVDLDTCETGKGAPRADATPATVALPSSCSPSRQPASRAASPVLTAPRADGRLPSCPLVSGAAFWAAPFTKGHGSHLPRR